ncbi:hypothetical protein GCWU000342_00546 [Shuttleworthella satelles DSM 14600]|uniref:Uncharacterized protein n=1 Tax=Shuttleworthella satelles DSM 14600 TaxID=626523 RepID=C4G995_9FIRM|nr:hypothetical protein GCWU000342_00546 [Shuttleworthia satelles DSM 14600]
MNTPLFDSRFHNRLSFFLSKNAEGSQIFGWYNVGNEYLR